MNNLSSSIRFISDGATLQESESMTDGRTSVVPRNADLNMVSSQSGQTKNDCYG